MPFWNIILDHMFKRSSIQLKIYIRWPGAVAQPVIPALWEAEEGGSQGQEIETILVNIAKPRLYKKYKKLVGRGGVRL